MKKTNSVKKTRLVLGIVMSSLVMVTLGVSSFAYWDQNKVEVTIPTYDFNATENEFTYYACIPNVTAANGYDYYDLESIPLDLVDRVTGLAVVRFEALTKTAYIPSYPKVIIGNTRFNYDVDNPELPVIHVLNSMGADDATVSNGFEHVETLIIPNTITFVQKGAFYVDPNDPNIESNLREVSILGKEENSGHVWYYDNKETGDNEFNGIQPHFESGHRHTQQNIYSLVNPTVYAHTQFNDEFEYDNISGTYYTYVITGDNEVNGTNLISDGNVNYSVNKNLLANTKYRIDLGFDSEGNAVVTADKYTYKLSYEEETRSVTEISLTLNKNVDYEEYVLPSNFGTTRISNYPTISVDEYINDVLNEDIESVFELNKLNATYTSDNICFEIKYAPSHVYESIHYRSEETELVDEKTHTQISVEKAYFLNNVTYNPETVENENFLEISVPNSNYLSLYVKATNSQYGENVAYKDPTDVKGENEYLEMTLVDGVYRYEFRGKNAPTFNVMPDTFVFYDAKYKVTKFPDYTQSIAKDKVEETFSNPEVTTRRMYLELYHLVTNNEGQEVNENQSMIVDDKNGEYQWYLVYWLVKNGQEERHRFKVYYAYPGESCTILVADVPVNASKFKFVRIHKTQNIDEELNKTNWKDIVNETKGDMVFPSEDVNIFKADGYEGKAIKYIEYGKMDPKKFEYSEKNKNYLVLTDYIETGKTRYVSLDENQAYKDKDVEGDSYALEFLKYAEYVDRNLQHITLGAGTKIEPKIYNDVSSSGGYYQGVLTCSELSASKDNGTAVTVGDYFELEDGKIRVLKDVTADIYLKVYYNSNGTTLPTYKIHFGIKNENLTGVSRVPTADTTKVVTIADITKSTKTVASQKYPVLVGNANVVKLDRNHANTDFEEYRYLHDSGLTGSYVISPYYEANTKFGGYYGNVYYGTINPDSPSGEMVLNGNNLVMFSPNNEAAYEEKYYAAFDDFGNFLTFLSFNRTQTINEGYQVLSAVIPQAVKDFQNVSIYEVDSEGKIKEDAVKLNLVTDLNELLLTYNQEAFGDVTANYIKYSESNELLFDYYLRYIESNDDERFYTNNIGFSSAIVDEDGDTLYYYYNVKINLSEATNSTDKYVITTKTNISTYQEIANKTSPLDEQIIDGYYYDGIYCSGSTFRFLKKDFKDGYYNIVLRKKSDGNLYVGYKYLGDTSSENQNYYLYLYDYESKELIESYKMDSMDNANHYFVDVSYAGDVCAKVYNQQEVLVYDGSSIKFTMNNGKISRFYYGVNTNINGKKLYQQEMGTIVLNFNMGGFPNVTDTLDDDTSNIRYATSVYTSDYDCYHIKTQTANATEFYYADDVLLKKHNDSYGEYIMSTEFAREVEISAKIDGETVLLEKSIVLPQPGNYYVSYNPSTGIVSCYKVQEPDVFYLQIDGEEEALLEINVDSKDYYEYVVKNHIVLQEDLVLVADQEHPKVNKVEVVSISGNELIIEKVTLTTDETIETATIIPKGAYSLTYSIDSSRRQGDKYHVFTYLNFISIDSNTITYKYEVENVTKDPETQEIISTEIVKVSEPVIVVTSTNKITWEFEIKDLEQVSNHSTPVGKYFVGWSTKEDDTKAEYVVGITYTTSRDLTLYPVYKDRSDRHPVIWLSELNFDSTNDIVFSLQNLENYKITSVSYSIKGYEQYFTKERGYVTIGSDLRTVTIKQSLLEVIGYVDKEGTPLVVHLESLIDGKKSTCTVKIPYPNYDNRPSLSGSYFTSFPGGSYEDKANAVYAGDTIKGLTGDVPNWYFEGASISSTNAKDKETDTTDLSLRLRATLKDGPSGKAKLDLLLSNVSDISFYMRTAEAHTMTQLTVNIYDINNELRGHKVFKNTEKGLYESMTYNLSEFDYPIYIVFEASTSAASNVYVHVDDLTINYGANEYSSTFSSNEYSIISRFATTETLAKANNDYSLDWKIYQARFGYEPSYVSGGESNSDRSNLSLIIQSKYNDGNYDNGYAITSNGFTSLNKVSFMFDCKFDTLDKVVVSLVDSKGNIIDGVFVYEFGKTGSTTSGYQSKEIKNINYKGENGEVYLKFEIKTTSTSTNDNPQIYIDNLKIEF